LHGAGETVGGTPQFSDMYNLLLPHTHTHTPTYTAACINIILCAHNKTIKITHEFHVYTMDIHTPPE